MHLTNGPTTPSETGQHRPRKRGRHQAGQRRHWERGVARGRAEAPRRRASWRVARALRVGATRHLDARRHGGSVTKSRACGLAQPSFIHLLVAIKPTNVFLGKGQQNAPWRRLAPPRPGTWAAGGARRHEALIRQLRAHGQIHCHVSVMSASSVHVIGGASQISWPA